jgi:hypothetical protein
MKGGTAYVGGRPMTEPERRIHGGGYDVEVWHYLSSGMRVERDKEVVLLLQNEYWLLNLSLRPIQRAVFLPKRDEMLPDGGAVSSAQPVRPASRHRRQR